MFLNIAATGIQPTGPIVYTATTTGATFRYRAGVPVEIRHDRTFQIFVGGRFIGGWNTLTQAIAFVQRY